MPPRQEGNEGHDSTKWFLPALPRVTVQPGGTDHKETSLLQGLNSHSEEANGTRFQVFPCSAGDIPPKAYRTAVYMGVLWRFFLGKIRFYCARLHVGGIITFRTASNTKGNNDTMIPGKILISHSLFL